jgi:UDPglucose--hexose-1-phosphate uridylyltransferase
LSGYRFDDLSGAWIVIADARRGLPMDPSLARMPEPAVTDASRCPFCPGRESETEETIAQIANDRGEWLVRVVGNRFPSVTRDARIESMPPGGDERPARGAHEVLVEAREHDLDLADLDDAQATRVLRMYRDRYAALERETEFAAVSLFRNRGRRAGSSQSHPHAQVLATSIVPNAVASRFARAAAFAEANGGAAILDRLVAREREAAIRLVDSGDAFDVVCPFAPHRAYETWIVPRMREAAITESTDVDLAQLAPVLTRTLRRLRTVTRGAAYNVLFRHPPVRERAPFARWHIEIAPRTGGDAGFELLTGTDVVPVAPEAAAAELRGAS